jgi:hypothetical protein
MAPSYALEPLWITSLKNAGIGRHMDLTRLIVKNI